MDSMIMLGAWILWKHRNACVLEGLQPNMWSVLHALEDEQHLWCLAVRVLFLSGVQAQPLTALSGARVKFVREATFPVLSIKKVILVLMKVT